jgi:hypothetical protein
VTGRGGSSRRRTSHLRLFAVVCLLALDASTAVVSARPHGAAAPRPLVSVTGEPARSGVLSIASVSPWVAPDGDFQVRFQPSTRVPDDARLTVTIHQSIQSQRNATLRDAVDEIVEGAAPGRVLQVLPTLPVSDLGDPTSGAVLTIPVRSRSANSERIFLPNPGIHPVQLLLTSADGPELWSDVVFLNRLPVLREGTRERPPVDVTLLLPIGSGPAIAPDGGGGFSLEDRTSLGSIAALLEDSRDAPLTLAPRPNTLDGLLLTDEPWAQRLLSLIGDEESGHQVLALPYAAVDSGGLVSSRAASELTRQIDLGRRTVERTTRRRPVTDTWAMDDTVTPQSLATLARAGVRSVLLPPTMLASDDLTEEDLAARPAVLSGDSGIRALAFDGDVSGRLAGTTAEPGSRAHEIATMLMATWFAQSDSDREDGPASVVLVTSGTDPRVLEALGPSLASDGPLRARPGRSPVPRADPEVEEPVVPLRSRPPADQRPAVEAAAGTRQLTEAYRSMTGEADQQLWAWERINDQTMSTTIGDGRRLEYHLAVRNGIDANLALIEPPRPRRVVVTSRETTIPLRFRNDLPFDVQLVMRARSPRLDIEGGESRSITLQPGENRIDLPVTVQAPGESLLRVELSSPVSGIELEGPDVPVQSTAISGVGAALSLVSIAFLIGWWIHTHRRRRREGAKLSRVHPSATGGASTVPPGG